MFQNFCWDIIQTMNCFALESFNLSCQAEHTKIKSRSNFNPGLVLISFWTTCPRARKERLLRLWSILWFDIQEVQHQVIDWAIQYLVLFTDVHSKYGAIPQVVNRHDYMYMWQADQLTGLGQADSFPIPSKRIVFFSEILHCLAG